MLSNMACSVADLIVGVLDVGINPNSWKKNSGLNMLLKLQSLNSLLNLIDTCDGTSNQFAKVN